MLNDTFLLGEKRFRLVHVAAAVNLAYTIRLDAKAPLPVRWSLDELSCLATNPQQLRIVAEQVLERPFVASAADIAVRDLRWSRIKGIVDDAGIWEESTRWAVLVAHAKTIGVNPKTLLADLRRYWMGGQTTEALLGNYFRSGRVEQATPDALTITEKSQSGLLTVVFAPGTKKARGRRPKEGGYEPLAIPAELRAKILQVARKHFEADATKSVRGATTKVLTQLFALRGEDGMPLRDSDGGALLKPPGQRPSIHQVRYLLSKALLVTTTFKRRSGAADFNNNHAPSDGSVLDDCLGPGDIYEIDATIIDLYVVARANRKVIIGKPTLYLVIDRHSRLIVGFYISLDVPSWSEAMQAILSISGDWESLCNRLGVRYDARDWPAQGAMCNRFFADRGEMISQASNALCDGVAIQVTNAPALLSRAKPIVESGFLSTHVPLREAAPGYEPPKNPFKRRGKKYHKDASLTLDELAAIYLEIVIAHNRKAKPGYAATAKEILHDMSATPRDIWTRGISERVGTLSRMPVDVLRRKLMPSDVGTVKDDGIHFKGCVYTSRTVKEWLSRASLTGQFPVAVVFTPNLVDKVIVRDKFDPRKEHIVELTADSREFIGYSFAEVSVVLTQAGRNKRADERFNEAQDVALLQNIERITHPAVAATKTVTRGVTPGMRLVKGDEARAVEAMERRSVALNIETTALAYGHNAPEASQANRDAFYEMGESAPSASNVPTGAAPADASETDPSVMNALFDLIETP